MWTREKAMKFRKIIEKAVISLTDADASIAPEMFPPTERRRQSR